MRKSTILQLLTVMFINTLHGLSLKDQKSTVPEYVECTSNDDCVPGYCCTISFERYSYPRCQKLHEENELCRPGGPLTTSGERHYPNNVTLNLSEIYMQFCPCGPGLLCDRSEQVCRDANDFNSVLLHQSSKNDD